jgi:hypothetical protein
LSKIVDTVTQKCQRVVIEEPEEINIAGMLLLVYWPEDNLWYYCQVKGYDPNTRKHTLEYDDGVVEQINLVEERFMTEHKFHEIKEELRHHKLYAEQEARHHQELQSSMRNAMPQPEPEPQEAPRMHKKPTNGESSMVVSKHTEKIEIDGFTMLAREYESSDDSFMDEDEYVQEFFPKADFDDTMYNGFVRQKKPQAQYDQNEDYALSLQQPNGYQMNYKNGQGDDYEMGIANSRELHKKTAYPNMQSYSWESQNKGNVPNGPFIIKKTVETNKCSNNEYIQVQADENAQLSNALMRLHTEDNVNTFDRGFNNYDSGKTRANGLSLNSSDIPVIYPSAERVRRDMKAFEHKFYERYLSDGYKLCE